MKYLKYGTSALVLVIALLVLLAPIGPLPGIFIGGSAAAAPADWGDTSGIDEVRLRVEGTVPRVVIIWVVQQENELYVIGANESGWVSRLGQGGPVNLRIGDTTYALSASVVTQNQLPIVEAYQNKYRSDYPDIVGGMGAPQDMLAGVTIFQLSR